MTLLAGWCLLALGVLAGWFCRFHVIEPEALQAACTGALPPAWCAWRSVLLSITFPPRFGVVAVVAAVAGWLLRGRPAAACALLALAAAGPGLFLYDTGWSASGALAALLRLPRIGEEPPDPHEFRA